jgi:SagB-type dehydrogenase family enzyme
MTVIDIDEKVDRLEHEYRFYSRSEEFHDRTRLKKRGKAQPVERWPKTWLTINFKGYPRLEAISLAAPKAAGMNNGLSQVLRARVSTRTYDHNAHLTMRQLSTLLYFAAGIKSKPDTNWDQSRRFYPSGGARYPLEVYPVIFGGADVPPGVYHYNVKHQLLEVLKRGNYLRVVRRALEPEWLRDASMVLFVSAVFGRNQVKYGDRGYRHILTENGHLAQNIYLVSTALGLGCSALGGYADNIVNNLLDIDGVNESVINAIVVGFPKI